MYFFIVEEKPPVTVVNLNQGFIRKKTIPSEGKSFSIVPALLAN